MPRSTLIALFTAAALHAGTAGAAPSTDQNSLSEMAPADPLLENTVTIAPAQVTVNIDIKACHKIIGWTMRADYYITVDFQSAASAKAAKPELDKRFRPLLIATRNLWVEAAEQGSELYQPLDNRENIEKMATFMKDTFRHNSMAINRHIRDILAGARQSGIPVGDYNPFFQPFLVFEEPCLPAVTNSPLPSVKSTIAGPR